MRLAIFVEICRHCLTRLALERSGGSSRRYVVIICIPFITVGVDESHEILVIVN